MLEAGVPGENAQGDLVGSAAEARPREDDDVGHVAFGDESIAVVVGELENQGRELEQRELVAGVVPGPVELAGFEPADGEVDVMNRVQHATDAQLQLERHFRPR